ncbi:MAG: Fic family protein [Candidatus Aenigmarchaeota archaeon]|nr:Fic family protein [Candidatus Aenigmarchaeota archaeon]
MNVEIRRKSKSKLFYLAHSFRDGGKVRKIRKYLGSNLSEKELKERSQRAQKDIENLIINYKRLRDPLQTVLSKEEVRQIENLVTKTDLEISHLSEKEWLKFTQLFTYDTNAIEGATVSFAEVKDILEKNKWPDKSKWEISETYGVAEAIKHIRKTKEHISTDLIKALHNIVFKNSKPFAGNFRGKGVEVAVVDSLGRVLHRGAPQKNVVSLLKELVRWYNKNKSKYHNIVLAAVVHNQFENIHPFQDGNGRIGRLLLNNILLKHGLHPVNIELKNRSEYYKALQEYQKEGNLRPTIELILKEYKSLRKSL